jgi:protein-S-isoprenylcysteine O-methyltransferase Ste14
MGLLGAAILICWAILFVFWFLLPIIFRPKRSIRRESGLAYRLLQVIGYVLLALSVEGIYPFNISIIPSSYVPISIGFILVLVGLSLAFWARITLGTNWSSSVTLKRGHELVQSGPYAYVRHPIYTAFLSMFVGTAVFLGSLGGLLGIFFYFVSFWVKLRKEEALMTRQFGKNYAEYRKRTRYLIPYAF